MQYALIDQEKLLKLSFEKSPLAALIIDAESKIILQANKAATKLYGINLEGKSVDRINYFPDKTYLDLRRKIIAKKLSVIQTKHVGQHKKIIDVECYINVFSIQGRKIFYSLIRDISEEIKQKEKLINEASIDELTGIPNRRFFITILKNHLENLNRYQEKFSVIYFDIDNFKYYNDQYGHAYGDEILKFTVKSINNEKRASDFLARLGGDEFALILNRVLNQNDLEKICVNLSAIINKKSKAFKPPITVSIGGYIVNKPEGAEKIISIIDRAMYKSKKQGGNKFHISSVRSSQKKSPS
jgi:diguanylate cyclase (GGDEF)-like protein/PAS domain S-box-containing protein